MKWNELHLDEALLEELGRRLAQMRIDQNLTQSELAGRAGVAKRTVERVEMGESTQSRTLFRLFRELGLLGRLDLLLPEPTVRPARRVKQAPGLPQRVARRRKKLAENPTWKWGDES
jgi:transcriptional regulator with XRE-family HTH domain